MGDKKQGPRDDPSAWFADRDLVDHSVRDPWEEPVGGEAADIAQQEYDSTPELRDLLTRAAASRSVVRPRREREREVENTRE